MASIENQASELRQLLESHGVGDEISDSAVDVLLLYKSFVQVGVTDDCDAAVLALAVCTLRS